MSVLTHPPAVPRHTPTHLWELVGNGATQGTRKGSTDHAWQGPQGQLRHPHTLVQQHRSGRTAQAQGAELRAGGARGGGG